MAMTGDGSVRASRPVDDLIDDIVVAGRHLAAVATDEHLGAPVPACGAWTVADVLWHLVWVHDMYARRVESLAPAPLDPRRDRPPDAALPAEFVAGLDRLVGVLRAADPAAEMWTITDDRTVGFAIRRMAHETTVHAWDVADALGGPFVVDAGQASDGIDEFLRVFLDRPADTAAPIGGTVHLHCTDVPGEWMVRPLGDGRRFEVTAEHAKGDCALRGPAAELFLVLWARRPLSSIEVIGDEGVAGRFIDWSSR